MKKKLLAIVMMMVMTVAMVGCSTDKKNDTASNSPTPASTNAATEVTVAPTESTSDSAGVVWPTQDKLYVGFSQADLSSTWRTIESEHMQQIADDRKYKISITNAEGDTEQQISDVESLIAQGCNVMVIVAIDADAIQPALDLCKEKKIPVIMKARGANAEAGVDYVTAIMSNFVTEGTNAANWVKGKISEMGFTGKDVKVLEIQGVVGGTDVRDRSKGFHDVGDVEGWDFVAIQSANWSRTEAQEVAQNVLQSSGNDINVIYCHNDEMALGASLAVQAAGLTVGKDILIVGVDGMKEALDAIKAGTQSLSVTCTPKYADLVFDTIEDAIAGKEIPTSIDVTDAVVDITNVDQYYELGF